MGGGRAVRNGGSDGTFYLGGRRNLAGVEAAAEFDEVAALLGARPQLVHLRAVDAELLAPCGVREERDVRRGAVRGRARAIRWVRDMSCTVDGVVDLPLREGVGPRDPKLLLEVGLVMRERRTVRIIAPNCAELRPNCARACFGAGGLSSFGFERDALFAIA